MKILNILFLENLLCLVPTLTLLSSFTGNYYYIYYSVLFKILEVQISPPTHCHQESQYYSLVRQVYPGVLRNQNNILVLYGRITACLPSHYYSLPRFIWSYYYIMAVVRPSRFLDDHILSICMARCCNY